MHFKSLSALFIAWIIDIIISHTGNKNDNLLFQQSTSNEKKSLI